MQPILINILIVSQEDIFKLLLDVRESDGVIGQSLNDVLLKMWDTILVQSDIIVDGLLKRDYNIEWVLMLLGFCVDKSFYLGTGCFWGIFH